ncbi:MAG: cupin-like domain-containing protein [Polyangiales bacterium]
MGDVETLAPEWAVWAAENLLRGVPRQDVLEALGAQGVSPPLARAALASIEASPAFVAARPLAVAHRRDAMIRRLLVEHAQTATTPDELPRVGAIDADAFFDRYYATQSPVVLTALSRDWPATSKWNPAWLKARFGDVEVSAVFGREGDDDYDLHTPALTRSVRLGEFVDRVLAAGESNDLYLVANNRNIERDSLRALWDDVRWDSGIFDPDRRAGAAAFWFGPGGTVTPLHHDTSNIVLCQMYGEKRVTLAAPWEPALEATRRGVYSTLDPEARELPDALFRRTTLGPGDALFIPAGWWHHVRALSVSISLGLTNFARDNRFNWFRPGEVR